MTDDGCQATVSQLLHRLSEGDRGALDALYPLVYDELRALARAQRRRRASVDTLNTTALVHEAYLKLVDQERPEWRDRAHFSAVAATAMRHLTIDYARKATATRRGGKQVRLTLDCLERSLSRPGKFQSDQEPELLVALDEALHRLARHSERQARIVECRFFAGLTVADTAAALAISPITVKRGWAMAQAWLLREMERAMAPDPAEGLT